MVKTILVVEDSPDISRLLEHILGQAGYRVLVVDNGLDGWTTFRDVRPDLVLLDVNLPGISGLELCQRIKEATATPVIMLTVQAEFEAVRRGLRAGADAYLSKPFEIAQLMASLEHALRPRVRRIGGRKEEEGAAQDLDR